MLINIDIKPSLANWLKKEGKKKGMARIRYIEQILENHKKYVKELTRK